MPQPDGQAGFAGALIDPDAPVPAGIVDPHGRPAPRRFAVYRNNVVVSLTEALLAAYPAIAALVGETFFREVARIFARANPPQTPLISQYGRDLPEFLEAFEKLANLPFLPDVARLDRLWLDSYHAADGSVLDPATLAGVGEERLVAARVSFLPATQLLVSRFPVVSLWNAGRANNAAANIDPGRAETALIVRPDVEVAVHALTPPEGVFFARLRDGDTLGEAAEAAAMNEDNFDLARALGLLVGSGACTAMDI